MTIASITPYLKKISDIEENARGYFVESLKLKNYGTNELTEHDMWILTNSAENNEYLTSKLKEAELALDQEAPVEEELSLDAEPSEDYELTLDEPAEEDTLSLSPPEEQTGEEIPVTDEIDSETVTDVPSEEDVTIADDTLEIPEEEIEDDKPKIETSLAGVGILPLISEIMDKVANGKPSEVELAALKAMRKLF